MSFSYVVSLSYFAFCTVFCVLCLYLRFAVIWYLLSLSTIYSKKKAAWEVRSGVRILLVAAIYHLLSWGYIVHEHILTTCMFVGLKWRQYFCLELTTTTIWNESVRQINHSWFRIGSYHKHNYHPALFTFATSCLLPLFLCRRNKLMNRLLELHHSNLMKREGD